MSLWRAAGGTPVQLVAGGGPPQLRPISQEAKAFVARASRSATFVVTSVSTGTLQRVAYALGDPADATFVVYAERAIPANRRVAVERGSAFADLHFATYLGPAIGSHSLQTTDVPLNRLPLSGNVARAVISFGDTTLTLVTSPVHSLGGGLGRDLPWLLIIGGILVTAAAAVMSGVLVRQRQNAEAGTQTISRLYRQLDGLYARQRTISETLQHALLPQSNPVVPNLEIASRYAAGAAGVDVGGDWYSLILLDDNRFAFVVGDVSGRGVEAATLMARVRFTLRAYLVEGHAPEIALQMCSQQVDIATDGHMVTALVGRGDLSTGRLTLANAGHLNPLVLSEASASYVKTTPGTPLGVRATSYPSTTIDMRTGETLLAFTDGLVERRGEDLDVSLDRLATAARTSKGSLEDLLATVMTALTAERCEDDIAILAFRWTPPSASRPTLDESDHTADIHP